MQTPFTNQQPQVDPEEAVRSAVRCLEVVPWDDFDLQLSGYLQSNSVVSGQQTRISSCGTTQQKQPGLN